MVVSWMKSNEIEDETYKEIEKEAKKRLSGMISEKQLGYPGLLQMEIRKIYSERGLEWHTKKKGVSID